MNALIIAALIYGACLVFVFVLFERACRQGPTPEYDDLHLEVVETAERIAKKAVQHHRV